MGVPGAQVPGTFIMIIPIAVTSVNWETLLGTAKGLLGESISTTIDQYNLKRDAQAYIVTLSELFKGKLSPPQAIAQAGSLLRHASATFLIHSSPPVIYKFQQETDLSISATETTYGLLAIVSGSLLQWQIAINNLRHSVDNILRSMANEFAQHFEWAGLKRITNV